jgi:hypothetical protein
MSSKLIAAGFILTAVVVLWQWRQRLRIAAVAA